LGERKIGVGALAARIVWLAVPLVLSFVIASGPAADPSHSVRIRLAQVAASAGVAFGNPALLIARSLARRVKHHRFRGTLSFSVHLTDQGGRTTKAVLQFTFH
jgi:hypothetical protein